MFRDTLFLCLDYFAFLQFQKIKTVMKLGRNGQVPKIEAVAKAISL
jgi:hypothetical protein